MPKELTPWEIGRLRESKLADGLRALAVRHGIKFREPLHIDSNGEFPLVVIGTEEPFCGQYGEKLARIIGAHRPRTGIHAQEGNYMLAENGWCYMNHFDVERMLEAQELYKP